MSNETIQSLQMKGYGYRKIAGVLGLSENTVKSYIRRHPVSEIRTEDKIEDTKEQEIEGVCLQCGAELHMIPHKRKKKFCSDKCRMTWWNEHQELVNKKAVYSITCGCCGKSFQSYGNKNRKYCSRTCYGNARCNGGK